MLHIPKTLRTSDEDAKKSINNEKALKNRQERQNPLLRSPQLQKRTENASQRYIPPHNHVFQICDVRARCICRSEGGGGARFIDDVYTVKKLNYFHLILTVYKCRKFGNNNQFYLLLKFLKWT